LFRIFAQQGIELCGSQIEVLPQQYPGPVSHRAGGDFGISVRIWWMKFVIHGRVAVTHNADLSLVRETLGGLSDSSRGAQGGQENSHEQRDDRYYDQQLNERESLVGISAVHD
jgi:hypothetical protein